MGVQGSLASSAIQAEVLRMAGLNYPYEVQVTDNKDPHNGHDTVYWLDKKGIEPYRHFDIDMHGGQAGYTSFYFKSKKLAIWTAIVWT